MLHSNDGNNPMCRMAVAGISEPGEAVINTLSDKLQDVKKLVFDHDCTQSSEITKALGDTEMLLIAVDAEDEPGMETAPAVAKAAKDSGILTVAFVSTENHDILNPDALNTGLRDLCNSTDTMVMVNKNEEYPGEALMSVARTVLESADIGLSFQDLRMALKDRGPGCFLSGKGSGKDKAETALKGIRESLLQYNTHDVSEMIINISGAVTMKDTAMVGDYLTEQVGEDTNVLYCVMLDDSLEDSISITVIAAGLK